MARKVQLTIPFDANLDDQVKINWPKAINYRILSKSLDGRGAPRGKKPQYLYQLEIIVEGEKFDSFAEKFPKIGELAKKPVIVGAGPAGLFAALRLSEYGISSILIERGAPANERMRDIAQFWRYGIFNNESNVCYGEGGAGLFSDGKLITRIKSPYIQYVMNRLVDFGAPSETAYLANPHLGSNKIRVLITKISDYLRSQGCEIHYHSKMTELIVDQGRVVKGVKLNNGMEIESDHVILATGHSASDVYYHLKSLGVKMAPKDFAVGVRIEHPRAQIDRAQYGQFAGDSLGASRYRLSYFNKKTERGTYSFCMCPGGYVLSSGTEADGIVVNGMSNYSRSSHWSNSAIVVQVKAGVDFSEADILNGLHFQREIENRAFRFSKEHASGREIPAQRLKDFLEGKSKIDLKVKTSCPSKTVGANLDKLLPSFISNHLKESFLDFDRKIKGFVSNDALLLAPETRTSSPLTISRDKQSLESESLQGLYPCGEGAGYAGGITSAAVDGIKVAMKIIERNGLQSNSQ